jgi:phosphopantothenoylcysteine decarboxylase/phosphopantothenate--cysteine ligase
VTDQTKASPRIVLGVTGSIAAYKAADLASKLVGAGNTVYPILTRGGAQFVAPATFSALTGNPCPIDTFEEVYPGRIAHIWLAQNCDLVAIVPTSMNVIARLAHGLSDDMLTAVTLATTAPILIAPAMNTGMWNNPATQANMDLLRQRGYQVVEPVSGRLACRTDGEGKLADVADMFAAIQTALHRRRDLAGKTVLVTAGPTREPLDPVRYLTNRSSGKMGYAVAESARDRGARVILVSGPVALTPPAGLETISVETAQEMENAVAAAAPTADVIIAAAAVADYRPATYAESKLKKGASPEEIKLARNPDILAGLGRSKRPEQVLIGFAAETEDVEGHAAKKLREKKLDWIVANDVTAEGAGFEVDTNIVTIFGASGERMPLSKMSKREVADKILDLVAERPSR